MEDILEHLTDNLRLDQYVMGEVFERLGGGPKTQNVC
jgi:hypothetical protein